MSDSPSPGAHVIARLLPVLSDQRAHQLRAMLADDIATREALAPANYSLVGIAALFSALGRVPSIAEYDEGRLDHDRPTIRQVASRGQRSREAHRSYPDESSSQDSTDEPNRARHDAGDHALPPRRWRL